VADGQRRALAGGDDEVVLAFEEEGEREGAVEPGDGLFGRVAGARPWSMKDWARRATVSVSVSVSVA
jgi:hypothetical protein